MPAPVIIRCSVFNQFGDLERCALPPATSQRRTAGRKCSTRFVTRYRARSHASISAPTPALAIPRSTSSSKPKESKHHTSAENPILQGRIGYLLKRSVGRHPVMCVVPCQFHLSGGKLTKPRRVIAKVEWHPGELIPRVGFIVTNLSRPAERVVAFYNKRGTWEQWIKEGKGAIKWTRVVIAARSPPTPCGSSFMRSPTISAISCARAQHRSRSSTGR